MAIFKLKDYCLGDTIVAISTFPAKSALGIIKISGKESISIISKIFKPAKKKNIKKVHTYTIHYGWIIDKGNKESKGIIDEVLVSIMRRPNSYTREDVVEISSHGGVLVLNNILEAVLVQGARLALAGEFTYRALISGRIDLLKAEGILNIVDAKTNQSLNLASLQLKGESSLLIKKFKEDVKKLFIQTESFINFPEDELKLPLTSLKKKIKALEKKVGSLVEASKEARILQEGLRCVICGKTNVGKSTLFNRLLREERVIVSEHEGTTRDVIEETINIRGVPLRIYDTAGILEPKDLIIKKALAKTSEIFNEADLVLLILDGSRELDKDDLFLLEKSMNKSVILIINKSDLPLRLDLKKLSKVKGPKIKMSALENRNLTRLENAVYNSVYKGSLDRDNIIFLNQYQRDILRKVKEDIVQSRIFLDENQSIDFINLCLKNCLDNLGKLTGEVFCEEILESIFSQFCIGK